MNKFLHRNGGSETYIFKLGEALEAMSKGIPVITINKFGGATLFDENTGWLYGGNSKEEYIENLKKAILECIAYPDEVTRRSSENYSSWPW